MPLKAFRINEFEAWAGETLEDAIQACMKECGLSREDAYDKDFAQELPGGVGGHR